MIACLVFCLIKLSGFWGQTHACSHSKWYWVHRSHWINIYCTRLKLFEEFLSNLTTKVPPLFWISRHVSFKKYFFDSKNGAGVQRLYYQVNVLKLCPRKEGSLRKQEKRECLNLLLYFMQDQKIKALGLGRTDSVQDQWINFAFLKRDILDILAIKMFRRVN